MFWISAPNTISALLAFDCVDRDEPNLRPHLMESLQWGVGIPLSWIGWFRGYRACCPSLEEGGGGQSVGAPGSTRSVLTWCGCGQQPPPPGRRHYTRVISTSSLLFTWPRGCCGLGGGGAARTCPQHITSYSFELQVEPQQNTTSVSYQTGQGSVSIQYL